MFRLLAPLIVGLLFATKLSAHPMPNTNIAVSLGDEGARFDIAVPIPELRLALPPTIPKNADLLTEPYRSAVAQYFIDHCRVGPSGSELPAAVVQSMSIDETRNENVGLYQELRIALFVPAGPTFDPRAFTLAYDAVIHQVPTHFAVLQVVHALGDSVLTASDTGEPRVIGYDFAKNSTTPLSMIATSPWAHRGRVGVVAMSLAALVAGLWMVQRRVPSSI